jgi:hypothetical protein
VCSPRSRPRRSRGGASDRANGRIQVYTAGLADPHVFNLTLHNNVIASGARRPGVSGRRDGRQVVERRAGMGVRRDALVRGRAVPAALQPRPRRGLGTQRLQAAHAFAVPNADDRTFVYGSNFEFSFNAKALGHGAVHVEIRPIVGWHLDKVDVIVNPILDTASTASAT